MRMFLNIQRDGRIGYRELRFIQRRCHHRHEFKELYNSKKFIKPESKGLKTYITRVRNNIT